MGYDEMMFKQKLEAQGGGFNSLPSPQEKKGDLSFKVVLYDVLNIIGDASATTGLIMSILSVAISIMPSIATSTVPLTLIWHFYGVGFLCAFLLFLLKRFGGVKDEEEKT